MDHAILHGKPFSNPLLHVSEGGSEIESKHCESSKTSVKCKISRPLPEPLPMITRKSWLKILGVTFQENPTMWDLQMNELMSRVCSRLYIIRTCKYNGFSSKELDLLFHSLISDQY